jgi:hypothetical protein
VTADYHGQAVRALIEAARGEHDFADWLAGILAEVAGQLGSSDALIEGRPGSWEAALVETLVKGTVGHEDQYLPGPLPGRKLTDAKAREIRDRYCPYFPPTQEELAAEYGVSPSTVSDICSGRTWKWLT